MAPVLEPIRRFVARWLSSPLQGMRFGDFARVLRENRFAVHPAYWPRVASTGLGTLLGSILARRELSRFGERIDATPVVRPIFILGHYRSGTTHLHNLLSQDSRLGFPNYYQVTFPHTFLGSEHSLGTRIGNAFAVRKRPQDNVAIDLWATAEDEVALCALTGLSPQMMWHFPRHARQYRRFLSFREADCAERRRWQQAFLHFARKLSLRHEQRPLVFKSPCHTARISMLLEIFPDARFVHIHRHPFEIFQSTRKTERKVAPFFRFQRPAAAELDEMILWRYRAMYDAFFDEVAGIPDGCFAEVSFDQLQREPVAMMRRIYETLDLPEFDVTLPAVERYLTEVQDYRRNQYGELDPALRQRISQEWSRVFDTWRYSTLPGGLHA